MVLTPVKESLTENSWINLQRIHGERKSLHGKFMDYLRRIHGKRKKHHENLRINLRRILGERKIINVITKHVTKTALASSILSHENRKFENYLPAARERANPKHSLTN